MDDIKKGRMVVCPRCHAELGGIEEPVTQEEIEHLADWAWKRIRNSIDEDAQYYGFTEIAAHTRDALRQMVRGVIERNPKKYDVPIFPESGLADIFQIVTSGVVPPGYEVNLGVTDRGSAMATVLRPDGTTVKVTVD